MAGGSGTVCSPCGSDPSSTASIQHIPGGGAALGESTWCPAVSQGAGQNRPPEPQVPPAKAGTYVPGHLLVGHGETGDVGVGVQEVPGVHMVGVAHSICLLPAVQLVVLPLRGLLGCWEQPQGAMGKAARLRHLAHGTGASSMALSPNWAFTSLSPE